MQRYFKISFNRMGGEGPKHPEEILKEICKTSPFLTGAEMLPHRHYISKPRTVSLTQDTDTMIVTIHFPGDPSVGMFAYTHYMTIDRFTNYDNDKNYREEIRESIRSLYAGLDGEFVGDVYFDDEPW